MTSKRPYLFESLMKLIISFFSTSYYTVILEKDMKFFNGINTFTDLQHDHDLRTPSEETIQARITDTNFSHRPANDLNSQTGEHDADWLVQFLILMNILSHVYLFNIHFHPRCFGVFMKQSLQQSIIIAIGTLSLSLKSWLSLVSTLMPKGWFRVVIWLKWAPTGGLWSTWGFRLHLEAEQIEKTHQDHHEMILRWPVNHLLVTRRSVTVEVRRWCTPIGALLRGRLGVAGSRFRLKITMVYFITPCSIPVFETSSLFSPSASRDTVLPVF